MPCLDCGGSKTIEAHLLPKAFVMEVKVDRGEQHLIVHKGEAILHAELASRKLVRQFFGKMHERSSRQSKRG